MPRPAFAELRRGEQSEPATAQPIISRLRRFFCRTTGVFSVSALPALAHSASLLSRLVLLRVSVLPVLLLFPWASARPLCVGLSFPRLIFLPSLGRRQPIPEMPSARSRFCAGPASRSAYSRRCDLSIFAQCRRTIF